MELSRRIRKQRWLLLEGTPHHLMPCSLVRGMKPHFLKQTRERNSSRFKNYRLSTPPPDVFSRDLREPFVDDLLLNPPPEAEAPSIGADIIQTEGLTLPADLKPDWRTPYLNHLTRGELPLDKTEARRIARRAKTFVIYGDNKELYRCSPTGIL
jgi:hypothetical protein